jgi:hypothetical protein
MAFCNATPADPKRDGFSSACPNLIKALDIAALDLIAELLTVNLFDFWLNPVWRFSAIERIWCSHVAKMPVAVSY